MRHALMGSRRVWLLGRTFIALVFCTRLHQVQAQGEATDAAARARSKALFEQGYQLAQRGDYEGAARNFEQAYALSPNASVLFNLGHAHAAAGDPVAAYDTLQGYLKGMSPGQVDPERQRLVRELIAVSEGRIGQLLLDVSPAGARIEVDARPVGTAPLERSLRLKVGAHAVVVQHPGYAPQIVNVEIAPRVTVRASVQLQPPERAADPGYLMVSCTVPDLELWHNDRQLGKTPLTFPIALPAGEHVVRLERSGYVPQMLSVSIRAGSGSRLDCEGKHAEGLERNGSWLFLADWLSKRPDARVYVDGRPLTEPVALLPSGRHHVEVRSPQFETWKEEVMLAPGATHHLRPRLTATEEYRSERASARDRQLLWSGITLGSGVVLSTVAVVLGVVNSGKQERWRRERAGLAGELAATDEGTARLRANYDEALEIQRLEYATALTGVLGAASFGVSALLWFTSPDVPAASEPRLSAMPSALGLAYAGRF